jgi:hypothetical protein
MAMRVERLKKKKKKKEEMMMMILLFVNMSLQMVTGEH